MVAMVLSNRDISPHFHKPSESSPTSLVSLHVGLSNHDVGPVSFAGVFRRCIRPRGPVPCARGAGFAEARVSEDKGVVGCTVE